MLRARKISIVSGLSWCQRLDYKWGEASLPLTSLGIDGISMDRYLRKEGVEEAEKASVVSAECLLKEARSWYFVIRSEDRP